jgi:hypothetical protein
MDILGKTLPKVAAKTGSKNSNAWVPGGAMTAQDRNFKTTQSGDFIVSQG